MTIIRDLLAVAHSRRLNDPQPGLWMIRCCRHCPEVAARIWICDHEPGLPANKVDQPYLQAQIGIDLVPPENVWLRRGREISHTEYDFQIATLKWLSRNRPTDPRIHYREPVAISAIPIPQFEETP